MASFILKNKSETYLRHESNGCSERAAAAECTGRRPALGSGAEGAALPPPTQLAPSRVEDASGSQCGVSSEGCSQKPWPGGQVDRWAGPSSLSGREARARSPPASPRGLALPPALCFHFLPVPFFSQVLLMTFQPRLLFSESFTPEHRKFAVNFPTKLRGRENDFQGKIIKCRANNRTQDSLLLVGSGPGACQKHGLLSSFFLKEGNLCCLEEGGILL